MKDYYIFQNCKLDADEHVLHIEGDKSRRLPVEEIAGLHLLSGYSMTSGVIDLAAKHNIPIHAYNFHGIYHGTSHPHHAPRVSAGLCNRNRKFDWVTNTNCMSPFKPRL